MNLLNLSKILQFILGFILGIVLLAGLGAGAAYYYLSKLAQTPPKPSFPPTENQEVVENTKPETEPEPPLEEGAYRARVTWPQGLTLRSEPDVDSERLGGVAYQQELIILGDSEDKLWQKVRVPKTGDEGWVKAGNVEEISD
jgi:hypothetical protein